MRVIVPYVNLSAQCVSALIHHAPNPRAVEFHEVSADDYAYGALLSQLWSSGDSFCVIEHDVKVGPTTLAEFAACDHGYCAAPYAWTTTVGVALGCTKFAASFCAEYPTAMDEARAVPSAYGNPGHWRQLDVWLMRRVLRDKYGQQPHGHLPPVEHCNPKQALRADADPTPLLSVEGF